MIDSLPDLGPALVTYRRNLNELVDRAAAFGAPMIFLTQPTMWADPMDPADAAVLLAGGVGPNNVWCDEQRYFSPRALAEGMAAFNEVLLEVCRDRRLFCIDLAAEVPKRRTYFYDDMHFNEAGAALVSDVVSRHLLDYLAGSGMGARQDAQ